MSELNLEDILNLDYPSPEIQILDLYSSIFDSTWYADSNKLIEAFNKALYDEGNLPLLIARRPHILIALAREIGPEKTRTILLPNIINCINEPSSNLQYFATILTQLQQFVPLIGGEQHIELLLYVFEKVFENTSELIKEHAFLDLNHIISLLSNEVIGDKVINFIRKLSKNEKNIFILPNSRIILDIPLLSTLLSKTTNESVQKFIELFKNLLNHENNLIKETFAKSLVNCIQAVPNNILDKFDCLILELIKNKYVPIQKYSIDLMIYIGNKLKVGKLCNQFLDRMILIICEPYKSPELSEYVATNTIKVMEFGDITKTKLLYKLELESKEIKLSMIAAENLTIFCEKLRKLLYNNPNDYESYFKTDILKAIQDVIKTYNHVPLYLTIAKNLLSYCCILERKCFTDHIYRMINNIFVKHLLNYSTVKSFENIPETTNWSTGILNINDALVNLIDRTTNYYHTKRFIIPIILQVSQKCGSENFKNIIEPYIRLICDKNLRVARSALLIFPLLVKQYGDYEARQIMFPLVRLVIDKENHSPNITSLYMMNELMFPTVEFPFSNGYLNIYKIYTSSIPQYKKTFEKKILIICELNEKLQEKLYNQIPLHIAHSYDTEIAQQKYYAEEILDTLKEIIEHNTSVFHIEENEACNIDYISYLETVLLFAVQHCESVIEIMYQNRYIKAKELEAKYFLHNMQLFSNKIKEELEPWANITNTGRDPYNITAEVAKRLAFGPREINLSCFHI